MKRPRSNLPRTWRKEKKSGFGLTEGEIDYTGPWGVVRAYSWEDPSYDGSGQDAVGNVAGGLYRRYKRSAGSRNPPNPQLLGFRSPSPLSGSRLDVTSGYLNLIINTERVVDRWGQVLQERKYPVARSGGPIFPENAPAFAEHPRTQSELIRLTNAAVTKMGAAKSNLAVSWLERQQTVDLATDTWKRVAKSIGSIPLTRRGWTNALRKKFTLKRDGRQVTNDWLAYRYGVMPTLLDLYGVGQAAEDHMVNRPIIITVKQKSSLPFGFSKSGVEYWSKVGMTCPHYQSYTGKTDIIVRLDAAVVNRDFRTMQQLGIVNPATVLFEVVPYSFVLDWVINLSDYIGQLSAFTGLSFLGNSTTTYTESEYSEWWSYEGPAQPSRYQRKDTVSIQTSPASVKQSVFNRSVSKNPPSVQLQLQNPLNLLHFADATALLVGAMHKGG